MGNHGSLLHPDRPSRCNHINCLDDTNIREQIPKDSSAILKAVSSDIVNIFTTYFNTDHETAAMMNISQFDVKFKGFSDSVAFSDSNRCVRISPSKTVNGAVSAVTPLTHPRVTFIVQVKELAQEPCVMSIGIAAANKSVGTNRSMSEGFGIFTDSW